MHFQKRHFMLHGAFYNKRVAQGLVVIAHVINSGASIAFKDYKWAGF